MVATASQDLFSGENPWIKIMPSLLNITRLAIGRRLRRFHFYRSIRKAYEVGWRESGIRYYIERKILSTPPIQTNSPLEDGNCEVHMLTYEEDWRLALWAAKSFYHYSGVKWPLIWHQGGHLARFAVDELLRHFPNSRYISQKESDPLIRQHLHDAGMQATLKVYQTSALMRKLIDVRLFGRAAKRFLLDSDILFFSCPDEIVNWGISDCQSNLFMRDLPTAFHLISDEKAASDLNIQPVPHLNSGISCITKEMVTLQQIEYFLRSSALRSSDEEPRIFASLIEQTLYALLAAGNATSLLPSTYLLFSSEQLENPPIVTVARHFAGPNRYLVYEYGIRALERAGFLTGLNSQLTN